MGYFGSTSLGHRLQNWVRGTTTLQEVDGAVIATRQDVWPLADAADRPPGRRPRTRSRR